MPLNVNAKEIWLSYFNKVLFEKGIITENNDKIPQGAYYSLRDFVILRHLVQYHQK